MRLKSGSTTFWLNFFIPGAGHLYASDGEKWGYLAINVGCALGGTVLVFPWLGNIVVWILSMMSSSAVTEEYNSRGAQAQDHDRSLRQEEEARQRQAREAEDRKKAEQQRITAAEAASRQAIDAREVRGEVLAQRFARLGVLTTTGMLSAAEAEGERRKLVAESVGGWTSQDLTEFLSPFADLLQQGASRPEDLVAVKGLYAALRKGRPTA